MFNLFGQKPASSDENLHPSVFQEQDIRKILQTFTLDSPNRQLFLSTSESGLVKTEEIEANLKTWFNQQSGRRRLSEIAASYTVDSTSVLSLIKQPNDWSMTSADSSCILSKHEQTEIVGRLLAMTDNAFIDEESFCKKEDLEPGSVTVLLSRYSNIINSSELFKFQPAESAKSFITSRRLREKLQQDLINEISILEESWKAPSTAQETDHRFMLSMFRGLNVHESLQLCQEIKERNSGVGGEFKAGEGSVNYTPMSYLVFLREQAFEAFREGYIPFLDVSQFVGHLQGQFENVQEALNFALRQQSNENPPALSFSPYVVSEMWINKQAIMINKTIETENLANIAEICSSLPLALKSAMYERLMDSLKRLKVSVVGDYAANSQWLWNLHDRARDLASKVAEKTWDQENPQRIKPAALMSTVEDMIAKDVISEHEIDRSSILSVLASSHTELGTIISAAYAAKSDELETGCDDLFKRQWISRVVDQVRLNVGALYSMEDGSLKTQLEELLCTHITTDIVSQTVSRANAKRLLRSPRLKLSSRLAKLTASLENATDLASTVEEIEKFNSKIGIENYDEAVLKEKARTNLADMVEAMSKMEDSPRLFLCLIIILSSSQYHGVLYATGKYAPRLLKVLKPTLDSELAQWLEQVKDAIKVGEVTRDMKDKMRRIASESLAKNP